MKKIFSLIKCKPQKHPKLSDDSRYREIHREYGISLNCSDVDMIEFDENNEPILVTETKHYVSPDIDLFDSQFIRLRNVADGLNVPLLCVVYYPTGPDPLTGIDPQFSNWFYYISPANKKAKQILNKPKFFTEQEFIQLQYNIRGLQLVDSELSQFGNVINTNKHPNITGYLAL